MSIIKPLMVNYSFATGACVILMLFLVVFCGIIYLGYRPRSKVIFDHASRLPLNQDE